MLWLRWKKPDAGEQEAEKYRDRAKERRNDETNPDYDGHSKLMQLDIEHSKYLGGDVEHTHLVKGLDYALLSKVIFPEVVHVRG